MNGLPITFVIKSFMRPKLAIRAVDAIRSQYGDTPILVVDDSPRDEVTEPLKGRNVRVLRLSHDVGLSAGRNAGVREVTTPYTVVIDDDVVVTKKTRVPDMVTLLQHGDIVCGAMRQDGRLNRWEGFYEFLPDKGLRLVQFKGDYNHSDGIRWAQVDFGLNLLVARTDFFREHRWDEELKVREHTDYFLRLKAQGSKVVFAPDCIFDHKPSRNAAYRSMRNRREFRLLFFHKHDLRCFIGISGNRDGFTKRDERALEALLRKGVA